LCVPGCAPPSPTVSVAHPPPIAVPSPCPAGELLAVKEIVVVGGEGAAFALAAAGSPSEALFEGLMREVNMMRNLKHRHIVRYIGTSVVENKLYLLLEYVPGRCAPRQRGVRALLSGQGLRDKAVGTGVWVRGVGHAEMLVTKNAFLVCVGRGVGVGLRG
jgi:hypothetical protein